VQQTAAKPAIAKSTASSPLPHAQTAVPVSSPSQKETMSQETVKQESAPAANPSVPTLNTPPPPPKAPNKTEIILPRNSPLNPEDRIKKFSQLKYDLNNATTLQQLDERPAYERRGVDIDFSPPKPQRFSRFSMGPQSQNGFSLRDNSFIFDNVD
jgi:hypothetical protein